MAVFMHSLQNISWSSQYYLKLCFVITRGLLRWELCCPRRQMTGGPPLREGFTKWLPNEESYFWKYSGPTCNIKRAFWYISIENIFQPKWCPLKQIDHKVINSILKSFRELGATTGTRNAGDRIRKFVSVLLASYDFVNVSPSCGN